MISLFKNRNPCYTIYKFIENMRWLGMAYKITYSNFKGGTGKTTNSTMMGYHLAAKGFKNPAHRFRSPGKCDRTLLSYKTKSNG